VSVTDDARALAAQLGPEWEARRSWIGSYCAVLVWPQPMTLQETVDAAQRTGISVHRLSYSAGGGYCAVAREERATRGTFTLHLPRAPPRTSTRGPARPTGAGRS